MNETFDSCENIVVMPLLKANVRFHERVSGVLVILYVKRFHRNASKVGAERKRLSITSFWLLKGRLFIVSSKSDGKDN